MLRIAVALVAIVMSTFSSVARTQICTPFTDVPASDPFCTNIQWMFNRGVTFGCTANQYCPANPVRRDQMAAFIYRLAHDVVFQDGGNAFGNPAVLGTTDNNALDIRVGGARAMRYEPNGGLAANVIGGSEHNEVTAGVYSATIGGGGEGNTYFANRVTDNFGTVAGGARNRAGNDAGGLDDARVATVSGGYQNTARGRFSTVSGGSDNDVSNDYGAIAGGLGNHANAYAFAAGGNANNALGIASFAAGQFANANGNNCAVFSLWGSSPGMQCFGRTSQFLIGAAGGLSIDYFSQRADGGGNKWVHIGSNFPPFTILAYNNAHLTDAGMWVNGSDAGSKDGFADVGKRAVLDKLAALPIRSWRYKVESDHVRHIGPTAQDFTAAFGLGQDDKTIGTIDADGVALAAIQGLNAKLEANLAERDARIATLAQELAQERRAREAQESDIAELRRAVAAVLATVKHDDRVAASAP